MFVLAVSLDVLGSILGFCLATEVFCILCAAACEQGNRCVCSDGEP